MKLSTVTGRYLAIGIGAVCAALVLPTLALAAPTAPRAPVSRCFNVETRVWVGQPGAPAAGTTFYQLEFSNIGHTACTLFGYPGVSVLNSHLAQVGLPAFRQVSAKPVITLRPGQTVHVVLAVGTAANSCAHPVSTTMLRVYPPNQFNSQVVPFPSQACPGKSTMGVDAVHPGAGIPGYTIR